MRKLIFALLVAAPAMAQVALVPGDDRSGVEHKIMAEALDSLRSRPGVETIVLRGWTVAYESSSNSFWAFAPNSYHALPALLKRTAVEKAGQTQVDTVFLCLGRKDHCHVLQSESKKLLEEIRTVLEAKAQPRAPGDSQATPAHR